MPTSCTSARSIAGNPKVYGQLVQLLAPYTRVIPGAAPAAEDQPELTPEAALAAQLEASRPDTHAPARTATRIRKSLRASGDSDG